MNLFELFGSIIIKNGDANNAIDDTSSKAQDLATKVGSSMKSAGEKFTKAGKAMLPVSVAVGGALTLATKNASDFQNGMAKMSTLFDTSKVSVSDLSNKFLELSNKTGIGATELAEAGYQALSAGVNVKDSVSFVETAGKLAKAGFTSTTTAVDVLTTAMNAYGDSAGTAEQIANKLVRTQNLGKTTVDELASAMGRVIPTASAMNVDINNLTSGYVSLTKQGIATAEATTYMNGMLNELGKSSTNVGKLIKEKTGKSFQECMKDGMSLADVLQILKQGADESGMEFKELWQSQEAGNAALAILNGGVDEFNKTVGVMKSETDDVGEALKKLETPSVKAKKALNQLKNSGIELGTSFLAALSPAIDIVGTGIKILTSAFNALPSPIKGIIAVGMGLIALSAPTMMLVGKVMSSVGTLTTMIPKMTATLNTAKTAFLYGSTATSGYQAVLANLGTKLGAFAATLAPMAGTIIAVAAVVAVLVAAFKHLWDTNEQFRTAVTAIWNSVKEAFNTFEQEILSTLNSLGFNFKSITDVIKAVWDGFCNYLAPVFIAAFQVISNILKTVLGVISGVFKVFAGVFNGDWSQVWDGIKQTFSSIIDGIKGIWKSLFNLLPEPVQNALETIKNVIQVGLMFIGNLFQLAIDIILIPFNFVWQNCKDTIIAVWETIKTAVSTAINAVKVVITTVMNAISSVMSSIWNAIKGVVMSVWNSISGIVSSVIGTIKGVISSGMNAVKSAVSAPLDAVHSKFSSIWNGAVSVVQNAIAKLKGATHFSWSLPHLKLPHISVSGKFSIKPPSAPKFGISWYKKAMDDPFMFTEPTLFDYNPMTGMAKGAGEAGDEIMYGRSNLMRDIREATSSQGNETTLQILQILEGILRLLADNIPALKDLKVVLDSGELIGFLTPKLNKSLGQLAIESERGM